MKLRIKDLKDEDARVYIIVDPFTEIEITAHKQSCFFCEHCDDILYDYSHGAYMFMCLRDCDWYLEDAMHGNCKEFKEESYEESGNTV